MKKKQFKFSQVLRNMGVLLSDGDWKHPNPEKDKNLDRHTKPFKFFIRRDRLGKAGDN